MLTDSGIPRKETPDMCKSPDFTGNSLEKNRHISYNIVKKYESLPSFRHILRRSDLGFGFYPNTGNLTSTRYSGFFPGGYKKDQKESKIRHVL